ncbi:MAG TPA: AAA family ATPase [Acidisarcina sp.]
MHEFIKRLRRNDRVLLVGDSRQHEALEAGRPFAQLQEAGMRTATPNDIVRQRDPELKQVIEQLASGQVSAAVESLDGLGRVHQVKGHEEREAAIAREYAKSPAGTLVVSPDNRSRSEINQRIHDDCNRDELRVLAQARRNTVAPGFEYPPRATSWGLTPSRHQERAPQKHEGPNEN